MILPTKHVKLQKSLIGVSGEILKHIDGARTVTSLWNDVRDTSGIRTFEQFSLGLDFLYCLGVVDFRDGLLRRLKK